MLISVIIPTYNRAHLVTDAIDSVLNQTYEYFELFIVDDHSTDNTKEVVEQYEDERVKYLINTRSKGAQGARNTGLDAAKGEWVAMLDSDDIWLPEKLEKQVCFIQKNEKKIVGLSTATANYDFDSDSILQINIPSIESYSTEELLYKNHLGPAFSSFIFKKEKALERGGFDEKFPAMQDMDFYISLSLDENIHVLQEILVYIRVDNEDRISKNYQKKLMAARLLEKKYNHMVLRDRWQAANRYGRILYYSILSDESIKLNYKYLITILFYDFNHFKSILKVSIKKKLNGWYTSH